MAGTTFEFRFRFWFIGGIYGIAFSAYNFDHVNTSEWLGSVLTGSLLDSAPALRMMRILFGAAALLPVLGAVMRTWAGAYLHSSVIHDAALHDEALVADGPYRHVRNPLYLGNVLMAFGFAFMASRIGFIILTAGTIVFVYRLILREEAGLRESQGEGYRRYCMAVPRLIPSWTARIPASGSRPDWKDGIIGEIMMWGCALAMIAFAATLKLTVFYIVLCSSLAFYILQNWIIHRRNPGL